MTAFLWINARHDRKIYCPSKVDEVGVALIFNLQGFFLFLSFVLVAFIALVFILIIFISADFAKNLRSHAPICLFVLLPVRIEFKNIQTVLYINFVLQGKFMSDLIFFLHQIELVLDGRIVLIFVLANLKEYLDHILDSLIDVGLVQDTAELIEDCERDRATHFLQMLPDLPRKANSNLNTIICGLVEQQQQNLGCNNLVGHLLIA
jgi:hypothetical protein